MVLGATLSSCDNTAARRYSTEQHPADLSEWFIRALQRKVIGKANRLGLSKKLSSEDKNIKKEISASSLVPNMSGCKWPIGHPGDNDFYFCGKPTIPGKPYCGEHCLIAYRRKDSHHKVKKFFKLSSEA